MKKLPTTFYLQEDVVDLSKQLLGKVLCSKIGGELTSGIICETEAYAGETDKASHAFGGRRTARTEIMYAEGGVSYVYLCYGIHYLFNVVSSQRDVPHAVLIRGIKPLEGIELILKRRKKKKQVKDLCIGPGKVAQALGIDLDLNGESLQGNKIWIEDRQLPMDSNQIIAGKRIGVDYAGDDALLPYRFQHHFE